MEKDKIINYIVSLNGGSGVIFQPVNPAYSYILTCRHVFDDITSDLYKNLVHINFFSLNSIPGEKIQPFELTKGDNYFPHDEKDIAILKISKLSGAHDLLRLDNLSKYDGYISLFGFPGVRRDKENFLDRIREDGSLKIGIAKGDGKREATIPGNPNYQELVGQSGGGHFCQEGNYIGLLGIQNKIPEEGEYLGRVEFTTLDNFDEIVNAYPQLLEPILPAYLKNFEFLITDIFKITTGLQSEAAGVLIKTVLSIKAKLVAQSNLTPSAIKEYLKEKLLLIDGQCKEDLDKKRIWTVWLELLTILNIAKQKSHCKDDFVEMFGKIRLFYSDTDDDFWLAHIRDLLKCDYTGLEKDGLVIVASNIGAIGSHVLRPKEIVANITALRKEHEEHQMEMNIAVGNDFPFDKYRFANISAFKEDPVLNRYAEFNGMTANQVLTHLKSLYVELIT